MIARFWYAHLDVATYQVKTNFFAKPWAIRAIRSRSKGALWKVGEMICKNVSNHHLQITHPTLQITLTALLNAFWIKIVWFILKFSSFSQRDWFSPDGFPHLDRSV